MKFFCPLSASVFTALLLTACNKKSDPNPTGPTKMEQISASSWTYQDAGIDANRDGAIDAGGSFSVLLPSLVPACRTDNTMTFNKDNSGLVNEGATKCNASDPAQTSFNWGFADNETAINVNNNSFALLNGKSKIVTLNATTFALTRDTVIAGTTTTAVVILKH